MKLHENEIVDPESGGEGELEDNISDLEIHSPNTPNRKRKETFTNYKRNEDLFIDSENESVTPSTPKMNFADHRTFSPVLPTHRTPQNISNNIKGTGDNDSVNPLSIDINKILMSQNFVFSDEEENVNSTSDTIEHLIPPKPEKSLHHASSVSSTSTFQSAISSWTGDNQSLFDEPASNAHDTNDDKWEVNSACSSTSGFYSAQEDFFDATFE